MELVLIASSYREIYEIDRPSCLSSRDLQYCWILAGSLTTGTPEMDENLWFFYLMLPVLSPIYIC